MTQTVESAPLVSVLWGDRKTLTAPDQVTDPVAVPTAATFDPFTVFLFFLVVR